MGTSKGEARRQIFAEAGYVPEDLQRFEAAEKDVLAGEDEEEVAERYGINLNDLWAWLEMGRG